MSTEVVGLDQSIGYARHLAEQAELHGPDGNEGYLARLTASRVTGAGLATGRAMQQAFAAAAVAAAAHAGELTRQTSVQEQYDMNPDAGDKTYLTGAAGTGPAPAAHAAASADAGEPTGRSEPPGPGRAAHAIRIATDHTEQSQVVVTLGPDTVRIDLADIPDEPDGGGGPFVLLDAAGVAALADAGAAMATAEKAARAEYKKLDARIGRLEQRREQIQNRPYETEQHAALRGEYDALHERGDHLYRRMRKQLDQLAADNRKTVQDLETQLTPDGDRRAVRAAQRQILTDAGIGQHDPFFTDQAEHDNILDQKAELRRRVAAIPVVPLTPKEKDELDRINTEIAAAEATLLDMVEEKEIAAGVIPAQDGAGLAWRTTVREEGAVSHQLDRRPVATSGSEHTSGDVEVPRLTGPQLRRVIQAVTGGQLGGVSR
jgi:hypothetical protein